MRDFTHRFREFSFSRKGFRLICVLVVLIFMATFFMAGCKTDGTDKSSGKSSPASSGLSPTATTAPTPTDIPDNTAAGRFFGPLKYVSNPKSVTHNEIRALYIGAAANLDKNINIVNNSAMNAFVIDLKESNGVYFKTANQLANDIGAVQTMYNIETVVSKCKANNIKLIGRIVCFKDHILSAARPDLCIKDASGNLLKYPLEGNKAFINPYNKDVWQYNIDIAKEAIALGFDEIQFDYVRFPTCNNTIRKAEYFGTGEIPTKIETITRFLQTAKIQIQDQLGIPLSADIYGIVLTSKLDGQLIGQDWETLGHLGLDTLSPMIYPSHYAKNTMMNGTVFARPSDDTYRFLNAVFKQEKFSETAGFSHVRCYIQAYSYTQAQIFGQIQALNEHGFKEYIYWNAKASYELVNVKQ